MKPATTAGHDAATARRDHVRTDVERLLDGKDIGFRTRLGHRVDDLLRASELLAAARRQQLAHLGRTRGSEFHIPSTAVTRLTYIEIVAAAATLVADLDDATADQAAALTHTEPQEEPMSTTKPTDLDLARGALVSLWEVTSGVGVELPDPQDPAAVPPWAAVDPGEPVGEALHGWTVATWVPLPGGGMAVAGVLVATPGAARLVVGYVRARGWRAETRPHRPPIDEAEVTS